MIQRVVGKIVLKFRIGFVAHGIDHLACHVSIFLDYSFLSNKAWQFDINRDVDHRAPHKSINSLTRRLVNKQQLLAITLFISGIGLPFIYIFLLMFFQVHQQFAECVEPEDMHGCLSRQLRPVLWRPRTSERRT